MASSSNKAVWPGKTFYWSTGKKLFASIPFTWELPKVAQKIKAEAGRWKQVLVGGPATQLIPDYFKNMEKVVVGTEMPGILQKINPLATRTTIGCIRKCKFCGIGQGLIENGKTRIAYGQAGNVLKPTETASAGTFYELDDWPVKPIICDNNLLACTPAHFKRVFINLWGFEWCDFNQGLDPRLLTKFHARWLKTLNNPIIRLSLDSFKYADAFDKAVDTLFSAGIRKYRLWSYCLIGFNDTPEDAWKRCEHIERYGIKPLPMWFHSLDELKKNHVTDKQAEAGWDEAERKNIMGWFYRHRGSKGPLK